MPYQATVVSVMIASPGDVAEERRIIQDIIHEWNTLHTEKNRTVLLPVMWETYSAPEMGSHPQTIINRQVLQRCDLLVAVFWTRIGTPTAESASGTVEEIRKHRQLNKPAMIYFSEVAARPESIDRLQYEAVREFRRDCMQNALIETYDTRDAFSAKFRRQLAQTIQDKFINVSSPQGNSPIVERPALSEQSAKLLVAAGLSNGWIVCGELMDGLHVSAGGHDFCRSNDQRECATWKGAIDELVKRGFLESHGPEQQTFSLTDAGYAMADTLSATERARQGAPLKLTPFFRDSMIGFSLANAGKDDIELLEIEIAIPKALIDPSWPRFSADSNVIRYSVETRNSIEYVIGTYSAGVYPVHPHSGLQLLPRIMAAGMRRDDLRPFYFPIKLSAGDAEREMIWYKAFMKGRPPLEEKMRLQELIEQHSRVN